MVFILMPDCLHSLLFCDCNWSIHFIHSSILTQSMDMNFALLRMCTAILNLETSVNVLRCQTREKLRTCILQGTNLIM